MKGVLLAGGHGIRLRPLTYVTNKHLLPVYDRPLIEYGLEALSLARIKDICVILGGAKPEEIPQYLGNGYKYAVNLHYRWQGEPKGIGHAILCAKAFTEKDPFIAYLADNIIPDGIGEFAKDFESSASEARILLKPVENPERYGVAEIREGSLVRLVEKPKKPKSNLAMVGAYCLKPSIFESIEGLEPSWRG